MIEINIGEVWEVTHDNFSGLFDRLDYDYINETFLGRKFIVEDIDDGRPMSVGIMMDDGVKGRTFWYFLQRYARRL